MRKTDNLYDTLAKYLCAAYQAAQLGISLGYALKTYVREKPGQYWYKLAEQVNIDLNRHLDTTFGVHPTTEREEIKKDFDELVSAVQKDNPDFRCCFIVLVRDNERPAADVAAWELILASGMPPDLLNKLVAHVAEVHLELMGPSKTKDGETIQ